MNNEDAVAKYSMENDCFTTRNLLQEEKSLDKYEAMRNDIFNLQTAMKHMNNEVASAKDGMENYCLTLCNTLQEEKLKDKYAGMSQEIQMIKEMMMMMVPDFHKYAEITVEMQKKLVTLTEASATMQSRLGSMSDLYERMNILEMEMDAMS